MQKSPDITTQKLDAAVVAARNARNTTVVRWYLMIYPFGRKGLLLGLDREIERRKRAGETPIEYFAPIYVEAKEVNGKIVNTEKQLFHNYVFVRASVRELFRMKKFEEQYNFPRREVNSRGEYNYPYVTDDMIRNLRWIAKSYSGVIPVYMGNSAWLVKGDRIKITSGPLKGIEAQLFEDKKSNRKDIMVVIDKWMTVPLLHVKETQYRIIALNSGVAEKNDIKIKDDVIPRLHDILCRQYRGEADDEDIATVKRILTQYANREPVSDIMRCKFYSILLMVHTILGNKDKQDNLMGIIHVILPAITAEQSKALLLTTMYGCTDNSLYYRQAHQLVAPWQREASPKKSKMQLINRLADYDRCLGH